MPKSDKNPLKRSSKSIQCYERQGYDHTATKCDNCKEKRKGKALSVSWDDDSEEERSDQPESPSNAFEKFVALWCYLMLLFCAGFI